MKFISRKKSKHLTRNAPKLERYDVILIVTEGTVTEPNYFNKIIDLERIPTTDVEVFDGSNSDPLSVVNEAIRLFEEREKNSNEEQKFDKVFCVIDRDDHAQFNNALNKAHEYNRSKSKEILIPIRSFPCFEYWYICHFASYRSSIKKIGKKSSGSVCESELNKLWKGKFKKDYKKSDKNHYALLEGELTKEAIKNSKHSLKDSIDIGDPNPSTEVHILVEYLLNIRKIPAKT